MECPFSGWSYLYRRYPEQSYIEDAVSNETRQVESQEVKVQTYNTEDKHVCLKNKVTQN